MAFDYNRPKTTALRLLTRYGQTMTLRRITDGAYSAGASTQTVVDETVTGAVFEYTAFEKQNSSIQIDDRKIMLAAKGMSAAPALTDQLIFGGTTFKIIPPIKPLSPAGVDVIYELQARG